MNKKNFLSIRNGVIASVIVSIVLIFFIEPYKKYVFNNFKWIYNLIIKFLEHLKSTAEISWYVIYVSILFLLILIIYLLKRSNLFNLKKGIIESFLNYNYSEDIFFGVKWRWKFAFNEICNLGCFCPDCNMELIPKSERNPYVCALYCEKCKKYFSDLSSDNELPGNELIEKVKREIRKKIRTGEWIKQK